MALPPLPHPFDVCRPAKVRVVLRLAQPALLTGDETGATAVGLATEALVVGGARIGAVQLAAVMAFASTKPLHGADDGGRARRTEVRITTNSAGPMQWGKKTEEDRKSEGSERQRRNKMLGTKHPLHPAGFRPIPARR